ncbi:MAG TPA: sodium:alanine symporter family protein [Candidatus Merdivicinus excrementipullorum]|uniref:Sodium:alanine symporter family protein n=1 Tax=Candidatus Merdivicinus excrementipullorum TaxID=2840867 RepID=A0A9D1FNK5_9FIRM|nr:sodium:alanine symporter family protein [Candidatus Merdivicinus excrementipullorum]
MQQFTEIIKVISDFFWNNILLFLLCGAGVYFTIRLKFVQVRKFGAGFKRVFGGFSLRGKKADHRGMSSFQALTTAIAAQVGTGNITGCATALASGGPGAIFWMWVSAFFGMATIYSEAVLAQKFRKVKDGQVTGGPIYYIRAAFRGKFGKILAGFFSIAIILALGFMGNMVQSNSIGSAFQNAFDIPPLAVGVFVAAIAGFIFLGGVKRLASVTEKLVPVMAAFYIVGCLVILVINHDMVLAAFQQIFVLAFKPQAIAGGVAGVTVKEAMRYGVARGLFSNEAGMGSTPHAHALAKVKKPEEQGEIAMIGVFIDTFVVLTLTALVILTSGMLSSGETGTTLAQMAFNDAFGSFGNVFVAICMLFFAFSTIIGWYFFGEVNVRAMFGKKAVPVYSAVVIAFVLVGSALKVDLVWNLSDLFNGLMVIPNLIALLALSGLVVRISKGVKGKKDEERFPDDPEVQKLMEEELEK